MHIAEQSAVHGSIIIQDTLVFQRVLLHPTHHNTGKQYSDFLLTLETLPVLKFTMNRIIQQVLFVFVFFHSACYWESHLCWLGNQHVIIIVK